MNCRNAVFWKLGSAAVIFLSLGNHALANENQLNIATAITESCANTTNPQALQQECASGPITDADYIALVTPDELPALYTSLIQLSGQQLRSLNHQLRQHRQGWKSTPEVALRSSELHHFHGGNAGSGSVPSYRLSPFLSIAQDNGDKETSNLEPAYSLDTDNIIAGADYRISEPWLVGIAFGQSDSTIEYQQGQDVTESSTDHLLIYSSWYRDQFSVDTTLAYAKGEFDSQRQLPDGIAYGNTEHEMMYFNAIGSFDFNDGAWTYGPLASLEVLIGDIDAFSETGDSAWNAQFANQDVRSVIYSVGAHTTYSYSFGYGVVIPYGKAEWRKQFKDERDLLAGRFVLDPDQGFSIKSDQPDSYWIQLNAGISAIFPHGFSTYIDYAEITSYRDSDLRTLSAGFRLEI